MDAEVIYIFKRRNKVYLIKASSLEDAWITLQRRASWNMDVVKRSFVFVQRMDCNEYIVEVEI